MSKLNIFNRDWVDIVFEGRNKSYGAYQLRSENPKVTTLSLFAGIALFGIALASPMIIDLAKGTFGNNKVDQPLDKVVEMQNLDLPQDIPPPPPPPIEEELPPPPPPPPADEVKSINDTKKFTEPEVAKKEEVKEEIVSQDDLKDADVGTKDMKGDKEKGEIKIAEKTGEADKGVGGGNGDGDPNKIFLAVQVQAEYPGGNQAFMKQFVSRFRAPDMDSGAKAIRVIVTFVVERDGSLTDIKVVRDPGFGVGKEAMRVLNNMPKWKPAEQNGKKVRSQFTLPITIQVQ